jgi:hypothetical protein
VSDVPKLIAAGLRRRSTARPQFRILDVLRNGSASRNCAFQAKCALLEIAKLIIKEGPQKANAIAHRTHNNGQDGATSKLKSCLSNLCDRGFLEVTDDGYGLSALGRQVWENHFAALHTPK